MGSTDRIVRILAAVIIAILFFGQIISGTIAVILLVLGGVFLLTGFIGFCPLYFPFGISTNKKKD